VIDGWWTFDQHTEMNTPGCILLNLQLDAKLIFKHPSSMDILEFIKVVYYYVLDPRPGHGRDWLATGVRVRILHHGIVYTHFINICVQLSG
jgi:hypothetical protein